MLELIRVGRCCQWLIVVPGPSSFYPMQGKGNASHEEEPKDHRNCRAQPEYKQKVGCIAREEDVRDGGEEEGRKSKTGHDETDGDGSLDAC